MPNVDLDIKIGERKTITFNTKDKYNNEDIVFNISCDGASPTATSTEITNPRSWFNSNIKEYSITPVGMLNYLNDDLSILDLLSNSNNGSFTISSYGVDLSEAKDGINIITTYLARANYTVFIENDIDVFINNKDTVALILKFDGMNVIIECYRQIT